MTCLDILQCSRPDSQISVSKRMSKGSILNNYSCLGLSHFVGCSIISVQWCMLRGDENISRGTGAGSPVCPHLVSLVELRGQIFMFSVIVRIFY